MQHQATVSGEDVAAAFVAARRAGAALSAYPGPAPTGLAAAYAIQDAAIALRGEAIAGWKIGRIHPPLSEEFGTTRLIGPVAASQCVMLDGPGTGYCIAGGFGAIEAELMLRVGPDNHIDAAHIGFEIASSPYPGINADGPLVTISDWGNNHGLLIGPAIPDWQSRDLDAVSCSMSIDGSAVGQGTPAAFPGGIGGSLEALFENLAQRDIALEPGQWISTGAITGVHELTAEQIAVAEFAGIGTIRCAIANQPLS